MTLVLPRLLLIAGNGRDSGKTTLACRLIARFNPVIAIVSVKISPHPYTPVQQEEKILPRTPFVVVEETGRGSGKDSSRMLAAGAKRSFFATALDDHLEEVMQTILDMAGKDSFYICESGGLRKYVEPGLFLILNGKARSSIKPALGQFMHFEHTWITFDGERFDFDTDTIRISHDQWTIHNGNDDV
jgi:hypothetical protein